MPAASHDDVAPAARDAWLAAGRRAFLQHGYNAAGIAAIAAEAGALKGSFYNHFASKEAFAVEVIAGYAADARIELLAGDGPASARIRAHFALLHEQLQERGYDYGCLLGNFTAEAAAASPAIRETVNACFAGWTHALAEAIAELPAGDASRSHATAALLIDAWEGALLRTKATGNPAPVTAFTTTALDLLLPGLD